MKFLIASLCCLLLFGACVDNEGTQETFEDFKSNDYNFNLDKKFSYKNIIFQLPSSFKKSFSTRFTITNHSNTFHQQRIGMYFSVERFLPLDKSRAFVQDFIIEEDLLNTFQDAYAYKRYESLQDGGLSVKKDLFNTTNKKGVIQVLNGDSNNFYGEEMRYALASIKIKNEFYVFQFITNKSLMGYSMDDFKRILHSVKSKK
jgi:hypothetical protein